MRLIYGTIQGERLAREFALDVLGGPAADYRASRVVLMDAERVGGLSQLDFQKAESIPITICDGLIIDMQDMSDYGEDFTYVDIGLPGGKERTIILEGFAGYYAVGTRLILRMFEYGHTFVDGARYTAMMEIWSDLDDAELPLIR